MKAATHKKLAGLSKAHDQCPACRRLFLLSPYRMRNLQIFYLTPPGKFAIVFVLAELQHWKWASPLVLAKLAASKVGIFTCARKFLLAELAAANFPGGWGRVLELQSSIPKSQSV